MSKTTKISEGAFKRGAREALTLKPLRDAARMVLSGKPVSLNISDRDKSRSVEIVRDSATASWRVKQAS